MLIVLSPKIGTVPLTRVIIFKPQDLCPLVPFWKRRIESEDQINGRKRPAQDSRLNGKPS